MKNLTIGYLYSGKIGKNEESFLKISKEKNLDVVLFDVTKPVDEMDLLEIQKCDVIFNDSGDDFAINFVRIFEEMGKKVVESSKAYQNENKWNFNQICKRNNIPTPETILLSKDLEIARVQLTEFNHWPVILKRVKGTWGEYVEKAENIDNAIEVINRLWEKGGEKLPIIAQDFMDSFSYRVTYIKDEIVQTAIKENNNWKCTGVYARNFKRFDVDSELKDIVQKIMNTFDIKICGIDLLKKDNHWYVIEVNTEPALDFFEEEREVLITKIIDLLIENAIIERNIIEKAIIETKKQIEAPIPICC
ncbi:MAG: ATP-grasp domain-containing protein [Candidatus Pacearchaeota archaeon]|jgi:glutathione synthase/RimK-type ligase-like ATP-grasp enzyme